MVRCEFGGLWFTWEHVVNSKNVRTFKCQSIPLKERLHETVSRVMQDYVKTYQWSCGSIVMTEMESSL